MTDRELMQQALDALRLCTALPTWPSITPVIEALRVRLAQPEQAPTNNGRYLTGYKAQPEPDDGYCQACDGNHCTAKNGCVARDNPPPQREWQGLTDEEIGNIIKISQITLKNYCSEEKQTEYARAIEAKLKEKNATNL